MSEIVDFVSVDAKIESAAKSKTVTRVRMCHRRRRYNIFYNSGVSSSYVFRLNINILWFRR